MLPVLIVSDARPVVEECGVQREPVGDVVVVVPGIMGSVLARDGHDVWNVSRSAGWNALRSGLSSVAQLRLPDGIGDKEPGDGVEPVGLMRTVHAIPGVWSPVVGYDGLVDWLRREFTLTMWDRAEPQRPANLVAFGYDWRLSNRYNGARLAGEIAPILHRWRTTNNPDAKLVLICHSMGGLLARFFLECCDGAGDCRLLITLGTPYRGSLAALVNLVNPLPGGGLGASLTELARSLPALYQLVPDYACLTSCNGLLHPGEAVLPVTGTRARMLADGTRFHDEVNASVRRRGGTPYVVVALHGLRQPTPTTATLTDSGRLSVFTSIDGWDEGGDGRVARLSASPPELGPPELGPPELSPPEPGAADPPGAGLLERGYPEQHGALPDNPVIRELIWQVLTSRRRHHRGSVDADQLGVDAPDLLHPADTCRVDVTAPPGADRLAVHATLAPADAPAGDGGRTRTLQNLGEGRYSTTFTDLAAGLYSIRVRAATGAHPLTRHLLVWDEQ